MKRDCREVLFAQTFFSITYLLFFFLRFLFWLSEQRIVFSSFFSSDSASHSPSANDTLISQTLEDTLQFTSLAVSRDASPLSNASPSSGVSLSSPFLPSPFTKFAEFGEFPTPCVTLTPFSTGLREGGWRATKESWGLEGARFCEAGSMGIFGGMGEGIFKGASGLVCLKMGSLLRLLMIHWGGAAGTEKKEFLQLLVKASWP